MELLNCYRDLIRLSRAVLKESKEGPARALEVLRGEPKSDRFRALWQTFYARLRVLSRHPPGAELLPLKERASFLSPANATENYCRIYVLYLLAYLRKEERMLDIRRSEMESLKVMDFVRRALIVT